MASSKKFQLVMSRCSLGTKRVASVEELKERIQPFFLRRRRERWTIDWRFTSEDAKRWVRNFVSKH